DLDTGAHQVAQAQPSGGVVDVAENVGLLGVPPSPVGLAGKRVGVQVRWDVAGGTGVGVLPPDAADVTGLLQHRHVGQTVLGQLVGGAEAAEAGADHNRAGTAGSRSHGTNGRSG